MAESGRIVDALTQRLGETVRRGAEVTALERIGGGAAEGQPRWRVVTAGGAALEADAVICALPAYRAAPLFEPHSPSLARALEAIGYASAAVVNLGYRESDFPRAPRSFGFVVPAIERRRIIAGSFTSLKFDGRAPAGTILVRAFVGGAMQSELMALDDAAMIEVVREEFRALLGVEAAPLWAHGQPMARLDAAVRGGPSWPRGRNRARGGRAAGARTRGRGAPRRRNSRLRARRRARGSGGLFRTSGRARSGAPGDANSVRGTIPGAPR